MARLDHQFRGDTTLNMDAKGRLAVPARVRDRLSEADENCLVVTKSPTGPCLAVYPWTKWLRVEASLLELPSLNPQAVALRHSMVGTAHETTLDSQNRILVPPSLRERAALTKRVTMVGLIEHLEIWNEDAWTARCAQVQDDLLVMHGNLDEELANVRL